MCKACPLYTEKTSGAIYKMGQHRSIPTVSDEIMSVKDSVAHLGSGKDCVCVCVFS